MLRGASSLTIALTMMAGPCFGQEPQSAGPTFDCVRATSRISSTICHDPSIWSADWALSKTYYALFWTLSEQERPRFRDSHVEWYNRLLRDCGLDERILIGRDHNGACVGQAYRSRASQYRRSLTGDAALEADLKPAVLVEIQRRLVNAGFFSANADGIYGAGTRQAIRAFKQTRGAPPSDFLTVEERSELLAGQPSASTYRQEAQQPRGDESRYRQTDPRNALPGMIFGMLNGGRPPPIPQPSPRNPFVGDDPSYRAPLRDEEMRRPNQRVERSVGPDRFRPVDEGFTSSPQMAETRAPSSTPVPTAERKVEGAPSEFSDSGNAVVTSPLSGQTRPAEAAVRIVEVVGNGETPELARKDAARLAIQQVAGVFVDNRRRIELSVSDSKVSEVVKEKIISYTNAYVSKLEVIKTERNSGFYDVTAKVSVAVAPLLKTLQENNVPTVAFDTATATATVQTMGEEKKSASDLYLDLLGKIPALVTVGVSQPKVDTSLSSSADEAWLSVPLTFGVNDEAVREWRSKFELFAQDRASIDFHMDRTLRQRGPNDCTLPQIASDTYVEPSWTSSYLGKLPLDKSYGISACFESYQTTSGMTVQCFGRKFVTDGRGTMRQPCPPNAPCYNFDQSAKNIRLVIEFVDSEKSVIFGHRTELAHFPGFVPNASTSLPHQDQRSFLNYCVGQPKLFYKYLSEDGLFRSRYGDTVIFPEKGRKVYAFENILLSNDVISRIAEVRARIEKSN